MKTYKLLSSTHCQMVSSGFLSMVYIVEFWETKGRKEARSCLVQASEPASLRRGSWLPLRSTPSGIKALILNCPLLRSVLSTLLLPDTPRLHTSAQGRDNLAGLLVTLFSILSHWLLCSSYSSRVLPRPLQSVSPAKPPLLGIPWVAFPPIWTLNSVTLLCRLGSVFQWPP